MANLKQYSERTDQEIRRVLEIARQDESYRIGEVPLTVPDRGRQVLLVRTDTNTATPTYPAFVDQRAFRLPIKLLKLKYNAASTSNPLPLSVVNNGKSMYCYSHYGWIPRHIDLKVCYFDGLLVPIVVPELEVTLSQSIASGAGGNVAIVKHGTANGQVFKAWFDHMDSGTASSGAEARVALMEAEKKWRIINRGC